MSIKKDKRQQNTILRVSAYLFRYKGLFLADDRACCEHGGHGDRHAIAIQRIFDGLKATRALDGLIYGVGLIALFYLGSEIFNSLRIRVNNTLEQRVLLEMRRDATANSRVPVSFYDQRKSGEISSRVIEDVAADRARC